MPVSQCCNNVSEKHMLALCCIVLTRIYLFNALSFFKTTACPGEIPLQQGLLFRKQLGYRWLQDLIFSYVLFFLILSPPLVTEMLGLWMQKYAVNIVCSLNIQALGTCISLFRNGWLYIFFAFCRDTVSYCVQVTANTQVNTLLG